MKQLLRVAVVMATSIYGCAAAAENVFIWCTNKSSAKQVAASYQYASFQRDRLSLAHIHGATGNKACGLTSDIAMAKFKNKEIQPPVGIVKTKDGQNLPLFAGVGGRALLPVNF